MEIQWITQRGDDWWCGDATASYSCGSFHIESFGRSCDESRALLLIREARRKFPEATLYIELDDETRPILNQLSQLGLFQGTEIELSARSCVVKIRDVI